MRLDVFVLTFYVLGHLGVTGESQDRFLVIGGKTCTDLLTPVGGHLRHLFGSFFRAPFWMGPGANITQNVIRCRWVLALILDPFPMEANVQSLATVLQLQQIVVCDLRGPTNELERELKCSIPKMVNLSLLGFHFGF